MEVGREKMNPCKDPGTHQSNFTVSRLCGNLWPEKEEEQKKKWGEGTPTLDESAVCGKTRIFRSVKAKAECVGVERVLGFCNLTQCLLRSSLPITSSGLCRVSLRYQQRGTISVQASSRKDNVVLKAKGPNGMERLLPNTPCVL